MNREIKFRAWDHQNNYWAKEDSDLKASIGLEFGVRDYFINIAGERMARWSFMQFTGLKDKNGKDIYEGDILRIHNKEEDDGMGENYRYTTVEHKKGAFKVEYDFGDYDMTAIGWAIDIWKDQEITCEVIGNIYENPELLNPGKNSTIPPK